MKKMRFFGIGMALALTMMGTGFAASFTDVPASHWAYSSVQKLVKAGLVEGYSDGTYRGDRPMNRYEFAAMVDRALAKYDKADENNQKLIDKLSAEFISELNHMGARVSKLEAKTNIKVGGETRIRFLGDKPYDSSKNLKKANMFDFRQRISFSADVNDTMAVNARIATGNELPGNTTYQTNSTGTRISAAANSYVGVDLANITMKKALGLDSIRLGRTPLDFFGHGLFGKPFSIDGITLNQHFGSAIFKGWTGNIKAPYNLATDTTNDNAQLTTGQVSCKVSDKLNVTAGYYNAQISSSNQNLSAASYAGSKGFEASFDYKVGGGLTLIGDYVTSRLDKAAGMPSAPRAWAIELTNSKMPPILYPNMLLVNPSKAGKDAWMVSYRSVQPGTIPAGAGGYDTTGVSAAGPSLIFPNGTDNIDAFYGAYSKVLAKNMIMTVECQRYTANNQAVNAANWKTRGVLDTTYQLSFSYFY